MGVASPPHLLCNIFGSSAESVGETGAKPAAIAPPADHGTRPRQGSPRTLGGCAALDTRCAPRSRHESAMDERGLRRGLRTPGVGFGEVNPGKMAG